jgi:hypothetical protein
VNAALGQNLMNGFQEQVLDLVGIINLGLKQALDVQGVKPFHQ